MSQLPGYDLALAQQFGEDRTGKRTASRRFVVPTAQPFAALESPDIPRLNSTHPDEPSLRLDRYNITSQTDGVCVIDCQYSTDGRFIDLRSPNKDAPAWYHWGWGSRKVQVEIPIAVRSKVLNTDVSGNEVEKLVWKIAKKQLTETRIIRPLQVRVTTTNVREFDIIAEQTDKLHLIANRLYHFEGGTVTQVDDAGTYDINYTWVVDNGTDYLPPSGTPLISYCQGPTVRPPYTIFAVVQDGNPETDRPKCFIQDVYETIASGWRSLPGANRIL
jgi:hypothetical protein